MKRKRIVNGRVLEFGEGSTEFSAADDLRLVDPVLTNLAQEYRGQDLVWPHLHPEVDVPKRSIRRPLFGKEAWADTRDIADKAKEDEARIISRTMDDETLTLPDRWLATSTDYVEEEEAHEAARELLDDRANVEFLSEMGDLWTELDAAETDMDASAYDADHKDNVTEGQGKAWNDFTDGTPLDDLTIGIEALEAGGISPNICVCSTDVYWAWLRHKQFRPTNATKSVITRDDIMAILGSYGIEELHVGKALKFDVADNSLSRAWGSGNCLLARVAKAKTQNIKRPSFGYALRRKGYPKVAILTSQWKAKRVQRLWHCRKPVVTSRLAGFLFYNAISL